MGINRCDSVLAVPPELAGLPWEALPSPDGGGPLALHAFVSLYRKADAAKGNVFPGPLRIVVAIAAPHTGGGPLLDYERELRNVLVAVRSARQDAADVRVVRFASVSAIREELDRGPAHVLHISGHGSPGTLDLEDDDGAARQVTADEFSDQAIPPGRMPPVITLSACYTDAAASQAGVSFAGRLCQRGAAAVIATETSITDTYATRMLTRIYGALAEPGHPDVVGAVAQARRQVQAELEKSSDPRDKKLAKLNEWAAVTILAAAGSVPVLDSDQAASPTPQPVQPQIAGLASRGDWYFVGRRSEQRRWPADLTGSSLAGIVIYGIGGTGKTALAAEMVARLRDRDPGQVLISLTGPLTLEGLLEAVITSIRRDLLMTHPDNIEVIKALDLVARTDLGWQERLAILRGHVLDHVPVLLVLDNFEDNLRTEGNTAYAVGDEVLAELLATWAADPGRSRLLVTCRYRFTLPGEAEQTLSFRHLGALTRAETMKLAWSLPALDRLDEAQLMQVWRLTGGHPRSLEYVDALLSGGTARYPDVTERLTAAVTRRLDGTDRDRWLAAHAGLDAALAETVALAADDVLLDDLLSRLTGIPGAAELLLGVSVCREPVDRNALLFQVGQPDAEDEDIPDRESVRRQISGILAAAGITDESVDLAAVPEHVQAQLAPYLAELNRRPAPPFRPVPGLQEQIAACQAASLLTVAEEGGEPRFFVHRWTAAKLSERANSEPGSQLARAHWQAARYWDWRSRAWPQGLAGSVHDLLEVRHHLLQTGHIEAVAQVTEAICRQLHTWGAWDQEASLTHDTLDRLPDDHPRRVVWIHHLGLLAQNRGDYDKAARHYEDALVLEERSGDQNSLASTSGQLGVLAQDRGDYDEAARRYEQSGAIFERIGDQAGMAATYHQLGVLADSRGDFDEAARQYQRALDIRERLGDQDSMVNIYHNLGVLAHERGDYDEAARQYQRSLGIEERLGNQAGMGTSHSQLANLARERGDYDEAARQYQQAAAIFERIGDQTGMASTYHELGVLAYEYRDYDEAARQCQRAFDIRERIGDQSGLARSYNQFGILADLRGDYDEAARQYQRALDICEQLGDEIGVATAFHNLGVLANLRGDYDEADRQHRRALRIRERLGYQAGMAESYSQLGNLEERDGGSITSAVTWHVKALMIRLHLLVPQVVTNLRHLAAYRRELGPEPFTNLLIQIVGDANRAEEIKLLVDRVDQAK